VTDIGVELRHHHRFGIAFVAALLFFTEYNTHLSGETSIMLFKRTKAPVVREPKRKPTWLMRRKAFQSREMTEKMRNESGTSSVDVAVPMMSDVFTWRHLEYDVRVGKGETRRLLEDVSGYVAPGKLTALMGESGAGKVSREYDDTNYAHLFSSDHVIECSRRAPGGWCCRR
jgi:ATP-binding cassette subfamily G (WHITE) protein 2 (SNQ2)